LPVSLFLFLSVQPPRLTKFCPHSEFMGPTCLAQQTTIISLHIQIHRVVFVTKVHGVPCEVRIKPWLIHKAD